MPVFRLLQEQFTWSDERKVIFQYTNDYFSNHGVSCGNENIPFDFTSSKIFILQSYLPVYFEGNDNDIYFTWEANSGGNTA